MTHHGAAAERAEPVSSAGLSWARVASPVGALLLVASPDGVVRLAFEREDHEAVLEQLATRLGRCASEAPERLAGPARELEEYFAGRRRRFTTPVDLQLVRGFGALVVEHLRSIEFGATRSYAQVAQAVGSPGAVRAVGTACARNPVPIFLPCHRVVRSDGTFGAYRGGPEAKRLLLELEAAA